MPIVRSDDQTASNESSEMEPEEEDEVYDQSRSNNIQNTYEYMNEKSFDRAPEIFESDPMESGGESDSQPEIVKVELDLQNLPAQKKAGKQNNFTQGTDQDSLSNEEPDIKELS